MSRYIEVEKGCVRNVYALWATIWKRKCKKECRFLFSLVCNAEDVGFVVLLVGSLHMIWGSDIVGYFESLEGRDIVSMGKIINIFLFSFLSFLIVKSHRKKIVRRLVCTEGEKNTSWSFLLRDQSCVKTWEKIIVGMFKSHASLID